MKVEQIKLTEKNRESGSFEAIAKLQPQLVLVFGATSFFKKQQFVDRLKKETKAIHIVGCSTAGEIANDGVSDNSCVVTGVHFDVDPQIVIAKTSSKGIDDSRSAGEKLGSQLAGSKCHSVFLISKGVNINGSALIEGLKSKIPDSTLITGGLAGDHAAFQMTYTLHGAEVDSDMILALGFQNTSVHCSFGSMGGWEKFGPMRKVTQATGNILHTLDGQPALSVYKEYLGSYADQLPGIGLLFPLEVRSTESDVHGGLIRTILGVDEKTGSLILAGDIHENTFVRLMNAKNEGLVKGAHEAAKLANRFSNEHDKLSILISCVGRKLVMGPDVEDEIDAVRGVIESSTLTGFYSNGEICPSGAVTNCLLHNQTMTITTISEAG